jgi:hypothetical protein
MKLSRIGYEINELVKENSHDFSPHYSKFEEEFINWYNTYAGLKNDIRIDLSKDNSDLVRLSILMSDFTSIFPYHKKNFLYTFSPEFKDRKIIGPHKYLEKISSEIPGSQLYAGYASVTEELLEQTFVNFYPLIEAEKVFVRPEKIIFAADLSGKNSGVTIHPADSNSLANEWRVTNIEDGQISYPIFDSKTKTKEENLLSQILIPYIKGISFSEYSKIILDEEDLLSSFRIQMKNYLKVIKEQQLNAEEFKLDVLQPKLDLINRKFTTLTNNHRLKVAGATIATSGLAILAMSQTGIIAALSQFISFGLGTAGLVKAETDYHENLDKIKDYPEYLLYRLNKNSV